MAYMEMFGNCAHTIEGAPPATNNEYVRHSVHLVQQWHQSAAQSLDTGLTSTVSCSFMHSASTSSSYSLRSRSPNCNGQIPPALPPKMRKHEAPPTLPPLPPSTPPPPSPPPITSTPVRREATPPPVSQPEDTPPEKATPIAKEDTPTQEPDLMEMVDVASYLAFKKPEEDEPEIRGGYVDALIVYATKSNKKG